jgi:DNA-binding response OmpR family regulator
MRNVFRIQAGADDYLNKPFDSSSIDEDKR